MILLNKPVAPNLIKLNSYLEKVNESGWYTNFGPMHQALTERLEDYLGVKNLLLVSNGTLAIQVAAKALNISKSVTTPFSFVATSSSLLWQGMDIAFSDINPDSLNISTDMLEQVWEENPSYDSLLATHVYGNPCDVQKIEELANKYNKKVIYDAAHAFGVNVSNHSVLSFGDASTLSFHATKVFHTVEGGAIVFKNKVDYDKAKNLINFGIQNDGTLGEPGINAKLNEYQAAVGLCLLDNIDGIIEHRSHLFELYRKELKDAIEMPVWHESANYNGAYMPICAKSERVRDIISAGLTYNNIQFRRYFYPSLDQAYPTVKSFDCEVSNSVSANILCLPLHTYMTEADVYKVTSAIKEVL
ncbi:DegT/DnrJ/EryC1/StrS family aminotransferase [Shewanella glacialipiscicola]|uniref:DegT/DnrJ/EryC1/StrS aminotransferase family protein n=1 Tax=Shewanella glacialipiscicola TaxID=614069 RepID=UPI0021D9AAFF|nr:DegT/DnrJ/EryC1/StrS family aminotransferase [Shewanella glacialipiscicola]MCU7995612.1 DegT/DnrJ/EryC1/StrS family aminotransferase [Shewanella glacialipiscicola]MCU8026859.1 DegT/DnrJ/EryC1/StrS family aminotransferase [Shewanella glacialipiscicola]